jgi:predicted RNA-binding protein with PIN domain
MHHLIDGYNLLHAMGVMHARLGPAGLEKARLRLLGLLCGAFTPQEAANVTVVFDAARAPPGLSAAREYNGIHVRFAVREAEADDLIEFLIGHDSAPKQLSVVSDDHRIQQAARRRHCVALGCGAYLDWLDRHRRERQQLRPDTSAKPARLSEAETHQWLREFADLQNDPDLKEAFEFYNFEDVDPDNV